MKNLLILYDVIFLLAGNVLFSNIHYMHDHQTNECQECIIIENSNNYVIDFHEINFSNNNINLFVFEYSDSIDSFLHKDYKSRAPPTS